MDCGASPTLCSETNPNRSRGSDARSRAPHRPAEAGAGGSRAAMIDAESVSGTQSSRAADLFRAFRAGDEAKMGDLVALLTPLLWHTARAQRLDAQAAEDVVQMSWLALVRSADSIVDPQA